MTPTLFDHPRAAQINAAGERADRDCPDWRERAIKFVLAWAGPGREFTGEDLVAASAGTVPEPKDSRAWGSVVVALARAGEIVNTGQYRRRVNGNAMPVWRRKT